LHELFDGEAGVGDDAAEGAGADLLVVGLIKGDVALFHAFDP
jgi:hypothetical protein